MARVDLQDFTVTVNIGNHAIQARRASGGAPALNIWDIPLQRQLDMAVQGDPLPNVQVGSCTTDRGAWMGVLWDVNLSQGQQYAFVCKLRCPGVCVVVVVVWWCSAR